MTATMNLGGETIRIARKYMPLLMQLHSTGAVGVDTETNEALDHLAAGRLLIDGELHPMAAAILEIIAEPPLVLSIERLRMGSVAASTIWANPRGAVVGSRVENDLYELKLANTDLIPFHVFQLIHLRPLPDQEPFVATLRPEDLLTAERHIDKGELTEATAVLANAGVEDAVAVTTRLQNRIASWTIHSVWSEEGGVRTGSASGIDCAAAGHVLVEVADDRAEMTLRSASFKEVLAAIRATLPS